MTLREVLDEAAAALGVPPTPAADGAVTWQRGEIPFASLDADGAAARFHLDPVVAEAAARTPDTAIDPAGPDWVRFAPPHVDPHAVDRASAWFAAAHRRATG